MEGLRYDDGKNRLDLLPPEWVLALGKVSTKGSIKYAPRNWEQGMKWSKVWGPLLRHAFAWLGGQKIDKETGCHHLALVAWNALALMTYEMRGIGENDLPTPHYLETAWVRDLLPEKEGASSPQQELPISRSPPGRQPRISLP